MGSSIQMRVYDNKFTIWNEGQLPENWTVEKLAQKHPSKPFNPEWPIHFLGLVI